MKNYCLLLVFCLLVGSCHQNRMKTDEKALSNQILTEEEQLAHEAELRAEREKQLADSIAKLPKGFQFKEERKADPDHPPVIIDIAGSRAQNPQTIKLSKLFSKIEYVRLEQIPDSEEFLLGISYIIAPNHIYVKTGRGSIFQYDRKGHLLKTICQGHLQYTEYKGSAMISKEQFDQFEGAKTAYWNGRELCYKYENRPVQKAYMVAFDDQADANSSGIQMPGSVESNNPMKGFGQIASKIKISSNLFEAPTPFLIGGNLLAIVQKGKRPDKSNNFINLFSASGDTMCKFQDHDPIRNFSKSVYRIVDDGNFYYKNGRLFTRQAINDTIFELVPPNQLIVRYILNFGKMGIQSAIEGLDPSYNLQEKLIPQTFLETNRFLFITYSKDYDCPNTAKKGTLKYSRMIYDKKEKTLLVLYIDQAPYIPQIKANNPFAPNMAGPSAPNLNVDNDLDEMPFRWPETTTAGGLPVSVFSGNDLLNLKNPNLPVKNIQKNDKIIAIYHERPND